MNSILYEIYNFNYVHVNKWVYLDFYTSRLMKNYRMNKFLSKFKSTKLKFYYYWYLKSFYIDILNLLYSCLQKIWKAFNFFV